MDSNGRPIKNNFTTKINVNNNNIEGVKDVILNSVPITQTIDEFKNKDDNIINMIDELTLRLEILENFKTLTTLQVNTLSGRISYLEQQNSRLKQIIYDLTTVI
jgi:hypothetical protein